MVLEKFGFLDDEAYDCTCFKLGLLMKGVDGGKDNQKNKPTRVVSIDISPVIVLAILLLDILMWEHSSTLV